MLSEMLTIATFVTIIETIITDALNGVNVRDMSIPEYREWLTFTTAVRNSHTFGLTIGGMDERNIVLKEFSNSDLIRNSHTFGLTIGGFAQINKSTLISIFAFILNYSVILFQTAK
ncbi:unnamed protein product [Medioppia subpectinata]|uniref:Uncharacterized protein n=1 Tax=Medioppia subpectinata TaxID=1979941 RepID=A0A7R9KBU2_9ACAR|nr:unnamed protein product [Medioppia subpectinata]CAG2100558.1 unnamed protein product [Medioppia subpectinata]